MKLLLLAVAVVGLGVAGLTHAFPVPQSAEPQSASAGASAAPTAGPGERTVDITEGDLSTRLNSRLAGQTIGQTPLGPATLQRITAQLRNGRLTANGDATVASTTVPVTVSSTIQVRDQRPVVQVDEVRSGGVPLPSSSRDSVQQALQTQLDAEVQRLGVRVSSVSIDNGVMHMVGSRS